MKNLDSYYKSISETHGRATAEAVEYLYSIFTDGIYKWLAGLWDRERGGFYFSVSARDNESVTIDGVTHTLLPDIESTSQAFGALLDDGIGKSFDDFPVKMKDKAVKFIASCQDPTDGYFYHKQWGKNINTSRRGRDMSKGVAIMNLFGAKPLYPTAIERITASVDEGGVDNADSIVPEHLRSRAAFIKYLESLNINGDSYVVGHQIASQVPEIKAAGLDGVCYEFLNSTQYDNGLWQPELTYRASNGLMKISCAYRGLGRPIPNMQRAFLAAVDIACLPDITEKDGITSVYNQPYTMLNLFSTMKDLGDDENYEAAKRMIRERAPELLYRSTDKLKKYAEPDGSFSYSIGHPSYTSQGMRVCVPGLPESDVNANSLAQGTRERMLTALDIPISPIFDETDTKEFFALAGEAE